MPNDDKRTYRQLLLIAVLSIFGILFMAAVGTLLVTYSCFQLFTSGKASPAICESGLGKFVLEFLGIVVGALGAIKLLGQ